MLLLVARPLPRDGGMAEDHGAPEARQLPRVWTRCGKKTESRQRVSGARRDRIMRSNSFDKQKVREIGQKEAGESRGFPIL